MRAFCTVIGILALTSSALAADLPLKAPPPAPVVAVPQWTGFYVGANLGYAFSHNDASVVGNDPVFTGLIAGTFFAGGVPTPQPFGFDRNGATAGLTVGYNWQFAPQWLVGVEGDFNWAHLRGSNASGHFIDFSTNGAFTVAQDVDWFSTVRARVGWLATSNLLVFATGGLAIGEVKSTTFWGTDFSGAATGSGFSVFCTAPNPACTVGAEKSTEVGFALGAGAEYAFGHWSLKGEYLYVNLGDHSVTAVSLTPQAGNAPASYTANFGMTDFHVVRAGLNYRF